MMLMMLLMVMMMPVMTMTRESGCIAKRWLQGHRPNYDWMDTGSIHMQIHWTLVAMYTHVNTQHTWRYHSVYKNTLIHGVFILIQTALNCIAWTQLYCKIQKCNIYMLLALNNFKPWRQKYFLFRCTMHAVENCVSGYKTFLPFPA